MVLEFVGTHVGGKLLDLAGRRGVVVLAGTEEDRAIRRAFEEAALGALRVTCDESAAPADEEAAEALAEHLANWLTEPLVADLLFRAANAKKDADAGLVVEHIERAGFDVSEAPFDMESFVRAFVPRLGDVVDREIRAQGMSQAAFVDKLNGLIERDEPRESAVRAARAEEHGSGARPVLVGVRSFTRRAEDMDDEMDELLRLENHFEDRHTRSPELWHEAVYPELENFLGRTLNGQDRYRLHLSAHTSIAFACGFLLDPKSGVDVVPVQRTSGRQEWRPDLDASAARRGSPKELWHLPDPTPLHEGGSDLVVAASVTHDVSEDVQAYARKNVPTAGRMLHFEVMPRASRYSVRDGTHALLLADELLERLRKARTPNERAGTVHLFAAAPAGLMFFAGRFARGLRRLALYEYDFEDGGLGAYAPSLVLPPRAARPARANDATGG